MKIIVPFDEVKKIVEEVLQSRNLPIKRDSGSVVSHTEGMYDDAQQVLDGLAFELTEEVLHV